jgi:hypothetical protein
VLRLHVMLASSQAAVEKMCFPEHTSIIKYRSPYVCLTAVTCVFLVWIWPLRVVSDAIKQEVGRRISAYNRANPYDVIRSLRRLTILTLTPTLIIERIPNREDGMVLIGAQRAVAAAASARVILSLQA